MIKKIISHLACKRIWEGGEVDVVRGGGGTYMECFLFSISLPDYLHKSLKYSNILGGKFSSP